MRTKVNVINIDILPLHIHFLLLEVVSAEVHVLDLDIVEHEGGGEDVPGGAGRGGGGAAPLQVLVAGVLWHGVLRPAVQPALPLQLRQLRHRGLRDGARRERGRVREDHGDRGLGRARHIGARGGGGGEEGVGQEEGLYGGGLVLHLHPDKANILRTSASST